MTLLGNKLDEEITLQGITLWEERHLAEMLMITPLGIPLISFVGGFDELRWGVGRPSPRTIFPL